MKLEILYDGKVVGSLSAGQTAIVPKGKKFTDDIVVMAVDDYTLSGTWVFNETVDALRVYPSVDFYCAEKKYYGFGGMDGGTEIWYHTGLMGMDSVVVVYLDKSNSGDGWYDEKYRTITFDGTQTVSKEFYEWFTANAVPKIKLSAPTITINGAVITITDTSDLATEFCFYSNRVTLFYTADTVVDLSEMLLEPFGAGAYNITVTALADGYEESDHSNEVECVVTERTYELSGTWTFKTSGLTYVGDDNYGITKTDPIGFTSNGKTFYRFMTNPSSFTGEAYSSLDYANLNGYTRTTVQKSNTGWVNTNYKTVTFNGTWTVDERFYKWYIANMECPIKFTIAGVTYGADANMTWGEWLESKYNTGKFVSRGLNVATNDSQYAVRATNNVLDDEIITNGYSYSLYYVGGHGGGSWD